MLEEKFVSEFFCPYFIGNLRAVTEHKKVVLKGVSAVNLLPDGLTGWAVAQKTIRPPIVDCISVNHARLIIGEI